MNILSINLKVKLLNMDYKDLLSIMHGLLTFKPISSNLLGDYSEEHFNAFIKDIFSRKEEFLLMLSSELDQESFTINKGNKYISFVIEMRSEFLWSHNIVDSVTSIFNDYDGLFAYIVSKEDSFWQNNESITLYKTYNKSLENIKIIPRPKFKNDFIVDTDQFPGTSKGYKGLRFVCCWMMWWGTEFYQFIDKERLETFTECDENMLLKDGGRRIKLYDNPFDYERDENRKRQWAFRNHIDLDQAFENWKLNSKLLSERKPYS